MSPLDVANRADEGRIVRAQRPALDENALPVAAVEPRRGVELRRFPGLAGLRVRSAQGLRANRAAEDERGGDECQPSEHRQLAVAGTPAAHARGEVPRTWP